jgi:hypothetical protein
VMAKWRRRPGPNRLIGKLPARPGSTEITMPTPFPSGQEEVAFSGVCLGARKLGYCCLLFTMD